LVFAGRRVSQTQIPNVQLADNPATAAATTNIFTLVRVAPVKEVSEDGDARREAEERARHGSSGTELMDVDPNISVNPTDVPDPTSSSTDTKMRRRTSEETAR